VTKPADEPQESEDLAGLIARRLVELGMSQRRLSDDTGIPYSTLNAWVTRRRGTGGGIDPDLLRTLARHLAVTPAEMFAAAGRRVPGDRSAEREAKLLRIYRNLSDEGQRALIATAETLDRGMRISS